jgi:hypothetical protein
VDTGYPFNDGDGLIRERDLEIGFRDEGGGVEFPQRLSDALSPAARAS